MSVAVRVVTAAPGRHALDLSASIKSLMCLAQRTARSARAARSRYSGSGMTGSGSAAASAGAKQAATGANERR